MSWIRAGFKYLFRRWGVFCLGILPLFGDPDLAEGFQFTDIRTGQPVAMGRVGTEQVDGFELLYATPGTGDIAEIAGHMLLRVRIKRERPDPDRDLVFSFLADTTEGQAVRSAPRVRAPRCRDQNWLNLVRLPDADETGPPLASLWESIQGLTGGFAVSQDVQTLGYTLKTYTVEQDRTLLRYALILTEEQKAGLVERLIRYPREPLPGYFFFHQNCGSVLVRLVGEGIGDGEVASFSPGISPPHSLVSLLIRKGLAEPVFPSFHSFRNRGRLYRTSFQKRYQDLQEKAHFQSWPKTDRFSHPKTNVRLRSVRELRTLSLEHPQWDADMYGLATLLQEMELVFDPKDRFCRDTTGPVTAEVREWQKIMLMRSGREGVSGGLPSLPPAPLRQGTPHTGLYRIEAGAGWVDAVDEMAVGRISMTGLRQEMGSASRLAMQRAGAVELFGLNLLAGADGMAETTWTGLDLRKFREGLGRVERLPWRGRAWGLGLRVLEGEWRPDRGGVRGTLVGVSGLLNLASTTGYDNHLYLTAGLDAGHGGSDWGIRAPVEMRGQWVMGKTRWKAQAGWIWSGVEDEQARREIRIRGSRAFAGWMDAEWRWVLEGRWEEEEGEDRRVITAGVEVLRF